MEPDFSPLATQARRIGSGLQLVGLHGPAAALDPFLMLDHFRMSEPTFPPHPHAGFSAITYLFDDSETGFRNRDSLGFDGPIEAGDLHWTLAGRGVMHEEFPQQRGRIAHGLQIFVNLPAAQKMQAPRALHLAAADMPRWGGVDWQARLVFGAAAGRQAPLALPVAANLMVFDAQPGALLELPLAEGEQGWLLVIDGEASAHALQLRRDDALALRQPLVLQARTPLRLVLGSGRPLREPLVQHGPFAMNTEAQIVDAMRRYQQGDMGRLQAA